MAGSFQVTCINKRGGHYNPHERIAYLGNCSGTGRWRLSEIEMIRRIESKEESFYTLVDGRRAGIIVAVHQPSGRKYLKTTADGYAPDNLLALPECPPDCNVVA